MKTKFRTIAPWRLAGWLALLAGPAGAAAQALPPDTSLTATALASARQQYRQALGAETLLFDGPEYVDNTKPGTVGHPFFASAEPQAGTVRYRGGYFPGVQLRYDLATSQVALSYPGLAGTVALVPEKIDYFTLGSHRFVRVAAPAGRSELAAGFYEVLLDGPVSLLARRSKTVAQSMMLQTLTFSYQQTDRLFVRTATQAAEVASLKEVAALLPARADELQRYARQRSLRFNAANREASVLELLRYEATLPR